MLFGSTTFIVAARSALVGFVLFPSNVLIILFAVGAIRVGVGVGVGVGLGVGVGVAEEKTVMVLVSRSSHLPFALYASILIRALCQLERYS